MKLGATTLENRFKKHDTLCKVVGTAIQDKAVRKGYFRGSMPTKSFTGLLMRLTEAK